MTGSGTMDPNGEFDITPSGGSIAGNALDIPESGAGGAVVGGKAEGVGGTWWAHGGSDWYGVGEYHGKR
jgi:hypothetical protein